MSGKLQFLCVVGAIALSGCASVTSETFSTVVLEGRSYELRTRTIDGPNGPYETSSVQVRGSYYLCKPDSPGDCEAAIREGRKSSSDND
ncbi:MAG: hypothetical protein R8G34_18300 [Paracoccaceae bacterium]|nr:hypothetical protein [Paracoccaceae bacterium]